MSKQSLYEAIFLIFITSLFIFISDIAFSTTCDEVLNLCEEAVISQEVTIKVCEEIKEKQENLIISAKEQVAATEKSLSNQKTATTTGFSLSGLLLLLLLL